MKAIIFFLLFLFFSFYAKSQEWAPSGATWHYSFNASLSTGFIQIKYIGDTIILGKGAKILQKKRYIYNFPGVYDTTLIGYEYTLIENNIVYYFRFGQFYKLYDFNSFAGDKWVVAGYGLNGLCDTLQEIKVDSIGLTNINGFNLKYQRINTKLTVWSLGSKLIERIGCIDSYMFPELNQCIVDLNEGGPLRCYYDSTFGLYQIGSKDCDYITNVETNVLPQTLFIQTFPNPAKDKLHFNFSKNIAEQSGTLSISDIYGRTVTARTIDNRQQSIQLSVKEFPKGMYLYQFKSSGFLVQRGKFIIQ